MWIISSSSLVACLAISSVKTASALLPYHHHHVNVNVRTPTSNPPVSRELYHTRNKLPQSSCLSTKSSLLLASAVVQEDSIAENYSSAADEQDKENVNVELDDSRASTILRHLQQAASINTNIDTTTINISTQQGEIELAERALIQWVDEYRSRDDSQQIILPAEEYFIGVIEGLLSLPSSFAVTSTSTSTATSLDDDEEGSSGGAGNNNRDDDDQQQQEVTTDEIRRALLGKKGTTKKLLQRENNNNNNGQEDNINSNKSTRATEILDLMELMHEPSGSVYDSIIASHATDALECLSQSTLEKERSTLAENDSLEPKHSPYYQAARKAAKAALQLLNRSEELYHETGQSSSRLPSVSSYVTVMDVWKALVLAAEEIDTKKTRDEAMEVVRNLRQRRVQVYTPDKKVDTNGEAIADGIGYNILPPKVSSMKVDEVLEFATNLLREQVPSYKLRIKDPSRIGTWHFNQLIFDLAKYPQSFSGLLAQDLLDYMVYLVKRGSSSRGDKSVVPKPNVETINAVLKSWMVTTHNPDYARRAEAILAKLAIWQSEGVLWGVSADTISYNTVIHCWKESGIPGAAQRATEILCLMEDKSTMIVPDVISYTTTIGAWADCSSKDPSAGRHAEEILMRMISKSKDSGGDESVAPQPTTRCFNAVLLTLANSNQRGNGKRALDLLRFMETSNPPDSHTFNIVMLALANCKERGASQKANNLLQRMLHSYKNGDTKLKPDLLSYNTVLTAYQKEGDAEAAASLLEQMVKQGDEEAKPDAHSYTAVLTACAEHPDKAMAIAKAEELFDDIERNYAAGKSDFRADTSVYNALINCWAKSGDREALYRVTQLLEHMEELGLKGGDSEVQPNSRTYCAVLDCLAKSKNYKSYHKSLAILERMEALYSEGHEKIRPCTRAYSIVLSTIARSKRKFKAVECQQLLHKMESEYRNGNASCRPNVYSYNAVLNAAAFSTRDSKDQEEAFKVACLTFDELRMSDYLKPTHVSYGTFLKAIKKMMPESEVRDDLAKGLFRKCCQDGLVSDFVLGEMADLCTADMYQSLLSGVTNDYGNLPKSWSANVRERAFR